jgi:hypothetical protein
MKLRWEGGSHPADEGEVGAGLLPVLGTFKKQPGISEAIHDRPLHHFL